MVIELSECQEGRIVLQRSKNEPRKTMFKSVMMLLWFGCQSEQEPAPSITESTKQMIPIRVGWQETWATQGQLAVILQQEPILESLGFDATFVGFPYGAPLNEGALAGEVDVLFTADQPAIVLCNRDSSWGMIGRLMYNRVGTFVPLESEIQSVADVKGKTIAIPFGAAAHRETLRAIQTVGLDPIADVTTVNMGINEIATMVRSKRWDSVHVGSAWDPIFADLEASNLVKTIAQGVVTSVVVMDDKFVNNHPNSDTLFMRALSQAYEVYKSDVQAANQRFIEQSKLSFSSEALNLASSVEPNLIAENAIRVSLNEEDKRNIQQAAQFMLEASILKSAVDTTTMIRRTGQ